jgi:hypothetical protein
LPDLKYFPYCSQLRQYFLIPVAFLSIVLPFFLQAQTTDLDRKSMDIPILTGDVTINGSLDESVWAQAVVIEDLHQVLPEEYATPTQPTQVRVFYTENALYVGATMTESDPDQITDRVLRQGQALSGDDVFAVILDPYLDRRNGYRFEVNPNGVRWEGLFQNITGVEGNWQGIWEARSERSENSHTVSIAFLYSWVFNLGN